MKPLALPFLVVLLGATTVHAAIATTSDRNFVAKVSQGGMFEVAAGKLAETKGSTQDVRNFATTEVHDHMLVGNKLKAISSKEGVAISDTANAEFSGKLSHLSDLSGAAFDTAYLTEMVALHDADGAAFDKEATDGGSPAYRAFGAETHRIVQRHIGAIHGAPLPR